jgi:hypothetical protein
MCVTALNIKKSRILLAVYIDVLCMVLRTTIIALYNIDSWFLRAFAKV